MGGDKDGGAEVVDALEQLNDFFAGEFVKVTGGLIGDEDFGLASDGTGDGDALLFPTREVGGKLVGFVGEPNQFQDFGDGFLDFAVAHAGDFQGEGDVLKYGAGGQEFVVLKNHPETAAVVRDVAFLDVIKINATHDDFAGVGLFFFGDHFDESGFASAGFADEKDELVRFNVEGDVVKRGFFVAGVDFGDMIQQYHGFMIAQARTEGKVWG